MRDLKNLLWAVVWAALASGAALAAPPASERTAAALMRVEQEWLTALKQRDVGTLGHILGQEFIDSDFQGDPVTRAQYLAFFAKAPPRPAPLLHQDFADTEVRFVAGGEVAIVTGVVVSQPPSGTGAKAQTHSRFTDVFVWRDGRWQAVTAQETHFTPGKG
jgi:ketosteroid isomerase-like protein